MFKQIENISLICVWPGAMINTHRLEQPLSRAYFHVSKVVRAIEVLLYIRDSMAVLQIMPVEKHASFLQLANVYMDSLLHCIRDADTVGDAFDRYDNKDSVKICRKGKASKCRSHRKTVSSDSRKMNIALENIYGFT